MPEFPFDFSKLDLASLIESARKMKEKLDQVDRELGSRKVESITGGGMVKVEANLRGEVLSISIDPELVSMNDHKTLETLILSAVNRALAQARAEREEEIKSRLALPFLPPGFPL